MGQKRVGRDKNVVRETGGESPLEKQKKRKEIGLRKNEFYLKR